MRRTMALAVVLTVLTAPALIAAPKPAKVGSKDLFIKSCEPVGIDSQSCVLCENEDLTTCDEYLCDKEDPPVCTSIRPAGSTYATTTAVAAIGYYGKVLEAATQTGDLQRQANALTDLGVAYAALGEMHEALAVDGRALTLHRQTGARAGEALTLGNLGLAYASLGDARSALGLFDQTLAILKETGGARGIAYTRYNRALALDRLGNRSQALLEAREALRILVSLGDPYAFAVHRQITLWS